MKSPASPHRVAALVGHRPCVQTLWMLCRLDSHPDVDLLCLAPQHDSESAPRAWAQRTSGLLTAGFRRKQAKLLDELFDGQRMRQWWREDARVMNGFPSLEHPHAVPGIAALEPDVIVFFRRACLAASLAAHPARRVLIARIGNRPVEDAMDVVMDGMAHQRPERLAWAIHEVDAAGDSERRVWSGTPQIAPGDTGETMLVRLAAELGDALTRACTNAVPAGAADRATREVTSTRHERGESSDAGIRTWASYLGSARGRYRRYVYERAVRC